MFYKYNATIFLCMAANLGITKLTFDTMKV